MISCSVPAVGGDVARPFDIMCDNVCESPLIEVVAVCDSWWDWFFECLLDYIGLCFSPLSFNSVCLVRGWFHLSSWLLLHSKVDQWS